MYLLIQYRFSARSKNSQGKWVLFSFCRAAKTEIYENHLKNNKEDSILYLSQGQSPISVEQVTKLYLIILL